MKNFLGVMVLAIIFFCGQNNFANAQDVYAGNTGGLDFYVDTNTITPTGGYDTNPGGDRIYGAFYVDVKKVDQNTGELRDINQWKFYAIRTNRSIADWMFDYYLSGTRIPVDTNHIAKNILRIVYEYTRNKNWGFV